MKRSFIKNMDAKLRLLERKAAIGEIPDQARFIDEVLRAGGERAAIQALYGVQSISRGAVVAALTNIEEQRRSIFDLVSRMNAPFAIAGIVPYEINPEKGDAALPQEQVIIQSILNQLSSEQAREMLANFQEPTLVLVPKTSTARHEKAVFIASQRMEGSRVPSFSAFNRGHLNAQAEQAQVEGDMIKGYEWIIVEGKQLMEVASWDDTSLSLGARLDHCDAQYPQESGFQRVNASGMAAAMVKSLVEGKPMGCEYEGDSRERDAKFDHNKWQWTILHVIQNGIVGGGCWSEIMRHVCLAENGLRTQEFRARCRLSLRGKIV